MTSASKTVSVPVPEDAWGEPTSGEYLLSVNLPAIYDKNGERIMVMLVDEDTNEEYEDAYTVSASYTSPYITDAEYVGLDPDPASTTAWDVYSEGWGFVNFLFSDVVSLTDSSKALITFTLVNGREIDAEIPLTELWADWDFWTGYFAVTVPMVENKTLTKANLESIDVNLYNIKVGSSLKNFSACYDLEEEAQKAPSKPSSKLTLGVDESYMVYDLNGNVIKTNVSASELNNLPKGYYIVNGQKFIIR